MTESGVSPVTARSIASRIVGAVQIVRSSSRRARTPGDSGDRLEDPVRLLQVTRPLGLVIFLEEQLDRGHQADDRLLADLAGASDGGVRRAVGGGRADQVGAAHEQARVLRPPDALAAAQDHEVGARLGPAARCPTGGRVEAASTISGRPRAWAISAIRSGPTPRVASPGETM